MTPGRVVRDHAITGMWYCAILSDEQIASGALAAIIQQFADVINAGGARDGACLFATIAAPGTIDRAEQPVSGTTVDGRAVFFSPASISAVAELIVLANARPAPPPVRCQVELLVGNQQDWDLLPRRTH